jgi:hypothetical protein
MQQEITRLTARMTALDGPVPVYAGTFRMAPEPIYLLKRGDVMQREALVSPGAIPAVRPAFALKKGGASESDRRLALADWIAHADNPLAPRVMVNRLWHWHFGQGLVNTPSDFGFNGDRPSHPGLLDWLAAEFRAQGGRLKPIHRLIVLSRAYRQASKPVPGAVAVDAGNRLLWRYTPHRLEAEAIRDTILQTSGALNRNMGGPGYHLWTYSGYVIVYTPKARLGPEEFRRMVYQFKPRLQQDRTFGAFDCPDATGTVPRRNVSTTALQALNLLNDPFVVDQSERFAERVKGEIGSGGLSAQVKRAFWLALGRAPTEVEQSAALKVARSHGLPVLCRALFNTNEFVHVP